MLLVFRTTVVHQGHAARFELPTLTCLTCVHHGLSVHVTIAVDLLQRGSYARVLNV